jgi:hypothetical protein
LGLSSCRPEAASEGAEAAARPPEPGDPTPTEKDGSAAVCGAASGGPALEAGGGGPTPAAEGGEAAARDAGSGAGPTPAAAGGGAAARDAESGDPAPATEGSEAAARDAESGDPAPATEGSEAVARDVESGDPAPATEGSEAAARDAESGDPAPAGAGASRKKGEPGSVWILPFLANNAVACASTSRGVVQKAQAALIRLDLVPPDDLGFWEAPMGALNPAAKRRFAEVYDSADAVNAATPLSGAPPAANKAAEEQKRRDREACERFLALSGYPPAAGRRPTLLDCVVPRAFPPGGAAPPSSAP